MTAQVVTANHRTLDLTYCALFAVLITVCSWISVPLLVPFTMQTFAVFVTLGVLGGKRGTVAICVYLLLGALGLPVFAGFSGGLGVLLGPTGGYLLGFVLSGLVYWLLMGKREGKLRSVLALAAGLLACYAVGTVWFMTVYAQGTVGLGATLALCVLPFILPDLIKLALAYALIGRLRPHIK